MFFKDDGIDNKIDELNDEIKNLNILIKFCDNLHGSGIDYQWKFKESNKYYELSNSYHCMNDVGMYDGNIDFTIKFDKTDLNELSIQLNGYWSHNKDRKYQIKKYLYDSVYYALNISIEDV